MTEEERKEEIAALREEIEELKEQYFDDFEESQPDFV